MHHAQIIRAPGALVDMGMGAFVRGTQEADASLYKDKETGAELEVIERMPLLEWLANGYKKFGCQLEFITNKSQVNIQQTATQDIQK